MRRAYPNRRTPRKQGRKTGETPSLTRRAAKTQPDWDRLEGLFFILLQKMPSTDCSGCFRRASNHLFNEASCLASAGSVPRFFRFAGSAFLKMPLGDRVNSCAEYQRGREDDGQEYLRSAAREYRPACLINIENFRNNNDGSKYFESRSVRFSASGASDDPLLTKTLPSSCAIRSVEGLSPH